MPDAAHAGIVFGHAIYVLGHGLLCGIEGTMIRAHKPER